MAETARAVETTVPTAEVVGTHLRVGTVVRLTAGIATRPAPLVTEAATRVGIVGPAAGKGTVGTDRRHGTVLAATGTAAATETVPLATTDVPAGSEVAHAELVASAQSGSLAVVVTSGPTGRPVATDPVGRTGARVATGRAPGTTTLAVEIAMPGAGKDLGTAAATAGTAMTGGVASVADGREVTASEPAARTRARATVRADRARVVATGTAVTARAAVTRPGDGTASTGMVVVPVATTTGTLGAAATGMAGGAVVTHATAVTERTPARVTIDARAVTEAVRVPARVVVTTGAVVTGARVATGAVRVQASVTTGAVVVTRAAAVTGRRHGAAATAVVAVTGATRVLAARVATAAVRVRVPPVTPGAVVATEADRPEAATSGAPGAMADGGSRTPIAETSTATGVVATGDRTARARTVGTVAVSVGRTGRTVRVGAAHRSAYGRGESVPNDPVSTRTVVAGRLGTVLAVLAGTAPIGDRAEKPVIRVAGIGASGVTVRGGRSTRPGNRPVRPFRTRSSPLILTVPSGQSCCPWPSLSRRRLLGTLWRRDS